MADIFDDNNPNEDIEFANKEWNKFNDSLEKDGLKDGIHEGRESGRQQGFDFGYKTSFGPFFTISSFEAIIDVLISDLKKREEEPNENVWTQLKTIKSNLIVLYELTEKHLLSLETNKLDSNCIDLSEEIKSMFDSLKHKTTETCHQFNCKSILDLINNLTIYLKD